MSPRPNARPVRSNLKERIVETAWSQIAQEGAAALSLRAIARELGIAAPSIYNYFPDRDALVTELIIQAYSSLGDDQNDALTHAADSSLREKFLCIGRAYRRWAILYPQRYLLIFGTPIPEYTAPWEKVSPIAAQSLSALIAVMEMAREAGILKTEQINQITQSHTNQSKIAENTIEAHQKTILTIAVLVWTRVHGLVFTEVSNNFPPASADGETLFEIELNLTLEQFIKESK